ncbi:MAG: ATPase [Verrucomicrobia bacterium]|jgi:ATP-binding protein involved in chromosome partitioning|nr:ATPase [Verrucomicrobiota bacterium]MBT7064739.1 ATPase [Verrucomicrobiota bacterium]MBT7699181.1 ATPase [Verrucomicrobiota bacterium]
MNIAIPLTGGKLSAHFGHCEAFALIHANVARKSIESNEMLTPPAHEPGVLPRWLAEKGAELVIAGGMGGRAQGLFQEQGIDVLVGAPTETPEAIAMAYLEGTLTTGANICDH